VMGFARSEFSDVELAAMDGVETKDGVLVRDGKNVVPMAMRRAVFDSVHIPSAQSTHRPLDLTLQVLKECYRWRNLDRDCIRAFRRCHVCRRARLRGKSNVKTGFASRPMGPNKRWSIDFHGPMPLTARGNRYLCGVRDHFSGKRMMVPTKNAKGVDAVFAMKLFTLGGSGPDVLTPDNALAFVKSSAFLTFCKHRTIEVEPPPAYSPEGNSAIESVWRGWADEAKTSGNRDWDLTVLEYCYAQNNKKMRAYGGVSAAMLDTGKDVDDVDGLRQKVRSVRRAFDAKVKERADAPVFRIGDEVDLWKPPRSKADVCFFGATVVSVSHPTYVVKDEEGREHRVNVRRLRAIPEDPFEKKSGDAADAANDESSDDDDADGDADAKELHEPPDEKLLQSLAIGDFILYRDGVEVYGGILTGIFSDAGIIEFQECIFVKKGQRVKAERTWLDNEGIVVQSNYRPKGGDPILYKTDLFSVVDKVMLDTGSLLPAAICDAHPIVIS